MNTRKSSSHTAFIAILSCIVGIALGLAIGYFTFGFNGIDASINQDTEISADANQENADANQEDTDANAAENNTDNANNAATNDNSANVQNENNEGNDSLYVHLSTSPAEGTKIEGTFNDDAINNQMEQAINLIVSCIGNQNAPDQSAADACSFATADEIRAMNDANNNFMYYDEKDNLALQYRVVAKASDIMPNANPMTIDVMYLYGPHVQDNYISYDINVDVTETNANGSKLGSHVMYSIYADRKTNKILCIRKWL